MYNPSLLKKSYETTDRVKEKINRAILSCYPKAPRTYRFIRLNRVETMMNDGYIGRQRLEMKQRQSFYIQDVYTKVRKPYKVTTIQASSTMHGSSVFLIYDLSCRYIQVFIERDLTDEVIVRSDETEYGCAHGIETPITLRQIRTDKTIFLDIENPKDIIKQNRFLYMKFAQPK